MLPILVLLALIGFAFWQGLNGDDDDPPDDNNDPSRTTSQTTRSQPTTNLVELDSDADCAGRDVEAVAAFLSGLNLGVTREEQENPGEETEGEVISYGPPS